MSVAGSLQSLGLDVDLAAVNQGYGGRRVATNLPLYPWQHETKHWDESRVTREWRLRDYPNHELLGSRVYDSGHLEPVWRNVLRLDDVPWLRDHQIGGQIIFPCSAYIAMAGEAIRQLAAGPMGFRLRGVCIQQGLVLAETKETEILTSLKPLRLTDELESSWWTFTISSCSSSNSWIRHVTGEAQAALELANSGQQSMAGRFARIVPLPVWYRGTQNLGMHYGPRFQCLKEIRADPVSARVAATIHEEADPYDYPYYIHPATIDQLMVLCATAACHGILRKIESALIPQAIGEVYVRSGKGAQFAEASATQAASGTIHGAVNALVDGVPVLHISGLRMKPTEVGEAYRETDTLAAVEPSWCPLIDFVPHNQLIRSKSNRGCKLLVEKLAVLCTIEGTRAIESSPAKGESHSQRKFRAWLSSQTKRIRAGEHPVIADAQRWVGMEPSVRQRMIGELADDAMRTPNAPYAQAILSIHDNLADILAGRRHALEVLSKHDCLTNIYRTVGDSMELKDFFNAYGRSRPYLRVLEIGAGTGGMTAAALEALTLPEAIRLYKSYTFTDISPGFFSAAMKKFEGYEGVEYQTLDISRDPVEQGFTPGQYDLIIAANVSIPTSAPTFLSTGATNGCLSP
jgi:acyl transferase domain-containing protein